MRDYPDGFRADFVKTGELTLHVVHNRQQGDSRPAIIFLHGFPEFWIAWREVFTRLAKKYCIIAPDQRGFNLSDAPPERKAYATRNMVADLFGMADHFLGTQPFVLAGHDWGASVAYAAAINRPERIEKLIIANGVHPVCFQEAMIDDPVQRQASQYFHILAAEDGPSRMAENDFARTFSMFEKFSASPWLTQAIKEEYKTAWGQPGRLAAMLHWYGSSPVVVPKPGDTVPKPPLYGAPVEKFTVSMPHLLIWGEKDQALQPSSTARITEFAPQIERINLADADHWLLHTHADKIAAMISQFLEKAG